MNNKQVLPGNYVRMVIAEMKKDGHSAKMTKAFLISETFQAMCSASDKADIARILKTEF